MDASRQSHGFIQIQEQLGILFDISSFFAFGPELQKILQVVLDKIGKKIDVTYMAIWLVNDEGYFDLVAGYNMSADYVEYARSEAGKLKKDEGVVGRVYVTQKPLFVKDFYKTSFAPRKYLKKFDELGVEMAAIFCVPLIARGEVIGTMNFYFPKRKKSISKAEIKFITIIANQLAGFIQNTKTYQRLGEEKNKTAAIIANFVDPVIVIDGEDRLSLINLASKEIFRIPEKAIGQKIPCAEDFSFDCFRSIIEPRFKVKKIVAGGHGQPETEELTVYPDGGGELVYKVVTAQVGGADKKNYGRMKVCYDLTREKSIDRLKSEFISIAAHQLRTPLSAIKWAVNLVLEGDAGAVNEEQKKLLLKGYESNERIIYLVNDMLNVTRIEEGRFGYDFKENDFSSALQAVLDSFENQVKTKKLEIKVNLPKPLPLFMFDRPKIELALQNLLENAVDYTPEHGRIEISVEYDQKHLVCTVKDDGVGIPKKDQARIFSKFFRAENVVRMQTDGSGLGLFLVKNIIEKHGGSLGFHSTEGQGATFMFDLPLQR